MKLMFICLFIYLFGVQTIFCALRYNTTSYILYPQFVNCGGGKRVSSNNFSLTKTIAQPVIGLERTITKNNFFGFVSYFIKVILGKMAFYDATPTDLEYQLTTNVECKITLESYTATEISTSSIRYRISNSGSAENKFSPWRDDVLVDTVYSNKKIRFKINFPNKFNETFSEGNNNYIQWSYKDNTVSAKYQIKILENDEPLISIIQPRDNDIVSINPVIEALVMDERWGVDKSSIMIKIENFNRDVVLSLDSSKDTNIWNSETYKVYYFANNLNLTEGQSYTLTIKVADKNGKSSTKSSTFFVKSGQLADVVPYPSPFDPSKQPVSIRYVLATDSEVTINIYNQSGMLIKSLVDKQHRTAGVQEDKWFGENFAGLSLANGIYFCEIIVKNALGQYKHYKPLAVLRR